MTENLRERRLAVGLSQFALAALAQVSRFKISLAECGYASLSIDEEHRIEAALDEQVTITGRNGESSDD